MNEHDDEDFDLPFLNFLSFTVYWALRVVGSLSFLVVAAPVLLGLSFIFPAQVLAFCASAEAWLEAQPELARQDLYRLSRPLEKTNEEADRTD